MGKINLVMTTDANYAVPTMVTISSILSASKKDSCFSLSILCAPSLPQKDRDMLKKLENKDSRIQIQFIEISDPRLDKAVTTAHISVASYYRLYISQRIMEDRCLYIDGDVIVRDDLTEVYNTDLKNYYGDAVKDLGIQIHMSEYKNYGEYLGISSMSNYVNAGFMLFNLNKIREDKVAQQMREAISKGYKYMDQDFINKYFYGRIKILPLKYDFFTEYYGSIAGKQVIGYSEEELHHIEQDACVLHFTGLFKPWLCTRLKINALWWKEAGKVLDEAVYKNTLGSAEEFMRKSDWKYILERAEDAGEIIIFGFSKIGKSIADRLIRSDLNLSLAFADNDKGKEGLSYGEIPLIPADRLALEYPDALYIISSQNGYVHIRKQLNGLGIDDCRIIRYIHKDESYYARLDERYEEKDFYGYRVVSPAEVFRMTEPKSIVICTTKYMEEVKEYLRRNRIKEKEIIDIRPFFKCGTGDDYFYEDFLSYSDHEVFVDAGCYDLGTTADFARLCSGLKKVYAFEPDPANYENCLRRLERERALLPETTVLPYGTWSSSTELSFSSTADGCAHIGEGKTIIKTAAIDDIVENSDKITFIKMDVEGSELESLKGAQKIIKRDRPKLAICIYHKPEDILTLPLYIKTLVPEYKLYLRSYSNAENEMVLYAVP